jgi:hypothetical protein
VPHDPYYLAARAAEERAIAESADTPKARAVHLELAARYDDLVDAERRRAAEPQNATVVQFDTSKGRLKSHRAKQSAFTIFRSAAEEAATKARQKERNDEAGHMSSISGLVISTPGAELPYKVVLRHEGSPDTERAFRTMQECEAFIRRNTPSPAAPITAYDQGECTE